MYPTKEKLDNHRCAYVFAPKDKWGENRCNICDIDLVKTDKLLAHNLAYHVTEKKFSCDQCNFRTKLAKSLTRHKQRVHEQIREEICYICGKGYSDVYCLKSHIKSAHSDNPKQFICDKCGATYPSESSLKQHINIKHPVYHLCSCCDKIFINLKKLRLHLLNEHAVKCGTKDFYVCWKCMKCHSSAKELDDHLMTEHQMNRLEHKCLTCTDKYFASKQTLKMHLMEFHEFNPIEDVSYKGEFQSALANDATAAQVLSLKSIQVVADSSLKGVRCDVCGRMLSCNRSLSDHKRQVHDKSNHLKCDQCSFTTFQPYMLKKHKLRQHDKSTKYSCDQCSFTSFDKSRLRVHVKRVHEKVKPHQCSECNCSYDGKHKLAVHMLDEHNIVYKYK